MRIIALQSENVKRLRAVSIKPDGSLVVIKGNNGQGKTSVLDSIAYALGGEKLMPPEVIRRGTESAEVALDLGDFIVTRRWTAGGSSLAVKSHEGARYPSPQTMLDKLIGRLSFDPVAFTRQEPKAQAETVRKLSGIDFAAIDEERRDAFDRRTIVNRDVAILKGAIARLPEVEAPDQEVKFGELLAEQDRLHAQQKQIEDARRQEQVAAGELPRAIDQRDRALEAIADLERQLSRAKEALAGCERAVAKAQEKRDAAHARFLEIDKPVDLESVKRKLAEAEGLNAKVRAKRARAVELEKLFRKESDSKGLTDKIEALDKRRAEILAGAKFPVPGLSFTETGVTLNGLPLEQASSAEQLRVSLAVGIALNPKLRVLLIRDGSLLDEKSLRLVAEMAETAGAQVWVELVSKGGPPGIVIEDGQVDEDSTPARFLAATDLGPGRRDEHG